MSNRSGFKVGDTVRVPHRKTNDEGIIVRINDVFEDEDGEEVDEEDGGEYLYTEVRVAFDDGREGYYDASELEHIDIEASFIPEDWS